MMELKLLAFKKFGLTSILLIDTLHSFIRLMAIGNCNAMTTRTTLKSEMQVNTVCAVKI